MRVEKAQIMRCMLQGISNHCLTLLFSTHKLSWLPILSASAASSSPSFETFLAREFVNDLIIGQLDLMLANQMDIRNPFWHQQPSNANCPLISWLKI